MEMNTRLQVEHPVTEEITGLDLVEQQLRIAAGEPLDLAQDAVTLTGHAFEARVYAEDPASGFLPTGEHVSRAVHPAGEGIRVDTALEDGLDVSVDYDPMLAKIIAWGPDRESARRRLVAALDGTAVFGFPTNVGFVRALLEVPEVIAGTMDTGLIARVAPELTAVGTDARAFVEAALLLDAAASAGAGGAAASPAAARPFGPWGRGDGWRLGAPAPRRYRLTSAGEEREVAIGGSPRHPVVEGRPARVMWAGAGRVSVDVDGLVRTFAAEVDVEGVCLAGEGALRRLDLVRPRHTADAVVDAAPEVASPMPGSVVVLRVADGDRVDAGDPVAVVEAMKMEHVVRATVAGRVTLHVAAGAVVARGQTLAVIAPDGRVTANLRWMP
ncbi:hypothetical protein LUZ63_024298 [Rhynchospora breviuscula]|uniref:Uncharacterized protein n=1 Tax=Rhynchospora breviuscula TaxID=2022672 RepID=A0A9P9Z1G0_9POAL|nr:hypothetical protein LUZ63_024298 [Rhynchospora breviuscula]